MTKIVMVDDHAIVRAGLKQILAEAGEIEAIEESASIEDLFNKLRKTKFDLIILDLNMPGRSGFEAIRELKNIYPEIPILVLSMYDEEQYGLRCLREGASGYLKKSSATEELVKAIKTVLNGRKYISQQLAEILLNDYDNKDEQTLLKKLTNRELEVLIRIARGQTIDEISKEMCLSQPTIYTYRTRLMEKLNLKSNVEITQFAIRNNLIEW